MTDEITVETWTTSGLLSHIKEIDERMQDRSFAFILGAGASVTSGIPTGGVLVYRWLDELQQRLDPRHNEQPVEAWANAENLGIEGFEFQRAEEFYPRVFQRRFAHDPEEGYGYLEDVMEGREPGLGYSILARILATTRHKVVITTNFDDLVADALSIYSDRHPMVCGHESLTGFVRPNLRRPLVAKIHRDLLFAPINDPDGTDKLAKGWPEALRNLFRHYTPVVIGYGGNDGSLMGFLDQLEPGEISGNIWWCYREEDGQPVQHILDTVKQHNGRLIPIPGFDEFMLQLGESFDIPLLADEIERQAGARADRYRKQVEQAQKVLSSKGPEEPGAEQETRKALSSTIEKQQDWWSWDLKAREFQISDPEKAEAIYRQGMAQCPESAELIGNFATFMTNIRKDHDEAERLFHKALELDPKHANITGSFAVFMQNIRQDHDEAERLFRKALELDPKDATNTGNFAAFMQTIRKDHDEAERLYRKALELDPEDAINTGDFAVFMEKIRKDHDEAERLYRKALEFDNEDLGNRCNFAEFLLIKDDPEQAIDYAKHAWALQGTKPDQTSAALLLLLALAHRLLRESNANELGRLKLLLQSADLTGDWSFEKLLDALQDRLNKDELAFYQALTAAILDQQKLADLEQFKSWQGLEPLPWDKPFD